MKLFKQICFFINLPGGTIVGLFSLEILAYIAYCAITGTVLSPVIRDIYLGVITCFAANRTAKIIKGAK